MKNELKLLAIKLKEENQTRASFLNTNMLSDYSRTSYLHVYNNTLKISNQLEIIINKY